MPRSTTRVYDSTDGLVARAGRAHEDPKAMTSDANWSRMARHVAEALKANPDLTAEQAAKAGRLTLRAEMAQLGRQAVAARRQRAAERRGEAEGLDPIITDTLTA